MGSRLAELQARYKQKQLQEMENKLKKLIPNSEQKSISVQMIRTTTSEKRPLLEERKQKAGIDRSYPLKPLKLTNTKITQNVHVTRSINIKTPITSNLTINKKVVEDSINIENEVLVDKSDGFSSSNSNLNDLSLNNKLKALEIQDKSNEKIGLKNVAVLNKPSRGVNKKSSPVPNLVIQNIEKKKPLQVKATKTSLAPKMSARGGGNVATRGGGNAPQRAPTANRPSARQTPRGPSAVTRDDLAACKFCNRRFAPDRLQIHEDICGKTGQKKRRTYDAVKHRIQGTELEPFVKKVARAPSRVRTPSSKRSNWRQTHNDFISTIRAAKQAQAYVAKGGKLSDLPPPPPSSNPDYVQCPYCGRKFNQAAAERHIPKCATYEFNKPKPGTAPRR
nr:zinc finger C2HC domain-containing protein 1C-like [Onthophagus taurus]